MLTSRQARLAIPVLLTLIAFPATAHACSCSVPAARAALRSSSAVFTGRVTALPDSGRTPEIPGWRLAHFELDAQWKLPAALGHPTMIPVYALDLRKSSCGLALVAGERYLVFAVADSSGRLTTGWCEGTRLYTQAASVVAALGPGHPLGEPDRRFMMLAFGGVAVVLVGALVIARRRPAAWSGR